MDLIPSQVLLYRALCARALWRLRRHSCGARDRLIPTMHPFPASCVYLRLSGDAPLLVPSALGPVRPSPYKARRHDAAQLKMFLPMILMWLYNKYGTEWSVDHIRIAYGVSQAASVLLQLYILSRIEATASTTETVTVKSKTASG